MMNYVKCLKQLIIMIIILEVSVENKDILVFYIYLSGLWTPSLENGASSPYAN